VRAREMEGLRAIVTGGASGIGLATVQELQALGARAGVLDRDSAPGEVLSAKADVTDDAAVRAAVEDLLGELGGLEVLVNCAGVGAQGRVEDNSDEEWHHVFDVNVVGTVRVTRACLPALRAGAPSAVVNVSSVAATCGIPERALYSATKGAVLSLTLAMAADLLRDGVRVNAVTPGTVDTPWVGRLLARSPDPEAERAALEARQPHGRLVAPEEVAQAIAYLASPLAGSTTGTWVAVDGGMATLRLRREG
jgi:2-keto-3-deoxy-L-fuconate dehydrogenase